MILVIDNYDSFTYNLVHYVEEMGAKTVVKRNDAIEVQDALAMKPEAVILSPGPCTPNEAGICLALIRGAPPGLPIFGVCLGHQALGQAFGGEIVRAREIRHGKISLIAHENRGLFVDLPQNFEAVRYHSLAVRDASLPDCFAVDATTADGEIMAIRHQERPLYGVQFHPESIGSQYGKTILARFLRQAGVKLNDQAEVIRP